MPEQAELSWAGPGGHAAVPGAVPPRRAAGRAAAALRRRALLELAEGVAHELKNQLTVVAASVQLARAVAGAGNAGRLLDTAFQACMRSAGLLDDLVGYARGSDRPAAASADAAEALETAVAAVWARYAERRVEIEMRPEPPLPRVAAHGTALRLLLVHVFEHLLAGAVPGERVLAGARCAGGGVELTLSLGGAVDWPADGQGAAPGPSAAVGRARPGSAGGRGESGGGGAEAAPLLEALAAEAGAALHLRAEGAVLALEAAE